MTDKERFEKWVSESMGKSFLSHKDNPALWGGDETEHNNNPYSHPWTRGAWDGFKEAMKWRLE